MSWNNFSNPYMPAMPGQFSPSPYMQGINANISSQMPQFGAQIQTSQAQNGLIRVTGIEGAKAFQMPPNSVAALFDDANDIFYVKSTDGAGFPTIRIFDFYEHKEEAPIQQQPINAENFATKQELQTLQSQIEEMKGMILNGKQSVPEQQSATANEPSRSRR